MGSEQQQQQSPQQQPPMPTIKPPVLLKAPPKPPPPRSGWLIHPHNQNQNQNQNQDGNFWLTLDKNRTLNSYRIKNDDKLLLGMSKTTTQFWKAIGDTTHIHVIITLDYPIHITKTMKFDKKSTESLLAKWW